MHFVSDFNGYLIYPDKETLKKSSTIEKMVYYNLMRYWSGREEANRNDVAFQELLHKMPEDQREGQFRIKVESEVRKMMQDNSAGWVKNKNYLGKTHKVKFDEWELQWNEYTRKSSSTGSEKKEVGQPSIGEEEKDDKQEESMLSENPSFEGDSAALTKSILTTSDPVKLIQKKTPPPIILEDQDSAEEEEELILSPQGVSVKKENLGSLTLMELIEGLAEGLQYDTFDPKVIRNQLFSKKNLISLNELVALCQAYIFVGNNATKLSGKVKVKEVGAAVLTIANKFKVARTKRDGKTLTLARIAIAFSPIIWSLRNVLNEKGLLPSSGVQTSTPLLLQDVSLGGISDKIPSGGDVKDFLIKFNRVLMKHKEKGEKVKSEEKDMDDTAQKYLDIAKQGVSKDKLIYDWDFNHYKSIAGIKAFYDQAKATSDKVIGT